MSGQVNLVLRAQTVAAEFLAQRRVRQHLGQPGGNIRRIGRIEQRFGTADHFG